MQGKITVLSEIGKGTVFVIEIPLYARLNSVYESSGGTPSSSQMGSYNQLDSDLMDEPRVLLFKHDVMNKNLFRKYLEKHKLKYTFATSFKNLLSLLKVSASLTGLDTEVLDAVH